MDFQDFIRKTAVVMDQADQIRYFINPGATDLGQRARAFKASTLQGNG